MQEIYNNFSLSFYTYIQQELKLLLTISLVIGIVILAKKLHK